jgi:catechol 2,3-dioxygenase-like lactoylglutathione lyase family enzyme
VNFDDPGTYHLYYGDRVGNPGTILTFFPWEHAAPGRGGVGLAQQTTFRIPLGSIGYWTHRFVEKGVARRGTTTTRGAYPVTGRMAPRRIAAKPSCQICCNAPAS